MPNDILEHHWSVSITLHYCYISITSLLVYRNHISYNSILEHYKTNIHIDHYAFIHIPVYLVYYA